MEVCVLFLQLASKPRTSPRQLGLPFKWIRARSYLQSIWGEKSISRGRMFVCEAEIKHLVFSYGFDEPQAPHL